MTTARTRLRLVVAFAIGVLISAPAAQGAMAVFDGTLIGKAVEQIQELKNQYDTLLKQLDQLKQSVSFLNDISKLSSDISDAIGKITHISLPIPNLEKIAAQTKSDLGCLMPNGVKWGIKFTDLNLASICDTSSKYRDALFVDPAGGGSFAEQEAKRVRALGNRVALLEDTASRALATADIQLQQTDELNKSADGLQASLESAETQQDRLHVQAQIEIAQLRGMARQTQLLAQMLKLHAAVAVVAGLPADRVKDITAGQSK